MCVCVCVSHFGHSNFTIISAVYHSKRVVYAMIRVRSWHSLPPCWTDTKIVGRLQAEPDSQPQSRPWAAETLGTLLEVSTVIRVPSSKSGWILKGTDFQVIWEPRRICRLGTSLRHLRSVSTPWKNPDISDISGHEAGHLVGGRDTASHRHQANVWATWGLAPSPPGERNDM